MNKIIIGETESGKSFLASNIALGYDNPVTYYRTTLLRESFRFNDVHENTDLIIVDDIPVSKILEVAAIFTKDLIVERQGKNKMTIKCPRVILIVDTDSNDWVSKWVSIKYNILRCYMSGSIFNVERQ
jgi:hypothetical protein